MDTAPTQQPLDNANLHAISVDGVRLHVEIAQDPEALANGLMFRADLKEDEGMLFVFESARILSFWMRNTFIPLDIAFVDEDGTVVDIQRMEALDERIQYISKAPALYAIETNAGWFRRNNLKVGSTVIF